MATLRYIGAKLAAKIDEELMDPTIGGFALEQLMELAGLSCAQAVFKAYPPQTHARVLVCAGPGNNGGDGLVAARHLFHWGYKPRVFYPKQGKTEIFKGLVKQLGTLKVPFVDALEEQVKDADLVLDAVFGFSFAGDLRAPFDHVLKVLNSLPPTLPIASIDIPSGWDVEKGNIHPTGLRDPEMLISLTAPKLGSREWKGRYHYLGGRFIPPEFAAKWELNLPEYPGCDQVVLLSKM
ncbi:YjeF N-terminal domain-containing protein [Hyaloraphidium curvatum]|nr:YjeF N-terminal domain-containing protein [Hyaloraphidium curvatum]